MADIFTVLKADHDEHRRMLEALADAKRKDRAELFEAFRVEVSAHAAAEEKSLYATMLANSELRDDGRHSVAEHKELDDLFGEMQELKPENEAWGKKFEEMRHRYEHHIDEEEEEMFPAAESHFSSDKAKALGEKFDRRKPRELEIAQATDSGSEKD